MPYFPMPYVLCTRLDLSTDSQQFAEHPRDHPIGGRGGDRDPDRLCCQTGYGTQDPHSIIHSSKIERKTVSCSLGASEFEKGTMIDRRTL